MARIPTVRMRRGTEFITVNEDSIEMWESQGFAAVDPKIPDAKADPEKPRAQKAKKA